METSKEKETFHALKSLTEVGLLAFVAYAPWHDAIIVGGRRPIGSESGILTGLTSSGLMNFLWILVLLICLLPIVWRCMRGRRWSLLETLLILAPVLVALNVRSAH